ncbi:MAG: hypothetical protein LAP87_07310 [Acidobacteriia bacterium]|nr:hypothetical protein [Terriglobia bacterium]
MKLRTLALALALSCGLTTLAVAADRSASQRVKPRKAKRSNSKAARAAKAHKAPKVKHLKH